MVLRAGAPLPPVGLDSPNMSRERRRTPACAVSELYVTVLTHRGSWNMTTLTFVRTLDEVFDGADVSDADVAITGGSYRLSDGRIVEIGERMVELIELVRRSVADDLIAHVEVDEEFVSPGRAAELLGVSRPTVYAWQDRGLLGRADRSNRRSVPLADVAAMRVIRAQRRERARTTLALANPLDSTKKQMARTSSLFEEAAAEPGSWAAALIGPQEEVVANPRRRTHLERQS